MNNSNFQPPKLITLRKLENYEEELKTAMEYYRTSVASSVFLKSMQDAPRLANELTELKAKYTKLLNTYLELKDEVSSYFDSERKIKELIK